MISRAHGRSVECHLSRPGSASLPRELLVAAVACLPLTFKLVDRAEENVRVKGLQKVAVAPCEAVRSPAPVL